MLKKTGMLSIALWALWAANIFAQDAGIGTDPFYPFEKRPDSGLQQQTADWGSDPFSNPLSGKGASQQNTGRSGRVIKISGIIYSNNVRLAIVEGESLKEGSMVGEQKLVDIRKRSIILRDPAGNLEEIFMDEFSIRK